MTTNTDNPEQTELKSCPNPECRTEKAAASNDYTNHYVYCPDCFLRGPRESTDSFGARWNSLPRVSASPAGPVVDRTALDEIEAALISIADGVSPQIAVGQAFNVINHERVRLNISASSAASVVDANQIVKQIRDRLVNGSPATMLAEIAELVIERSQREGKCEHGILWSMECLSCGHSDYVAAASPASTQEDAEHVSEL